MRALALASLAVAAILLPIGVGIAVADAAHEREAARQRLAQIAQGHAREIEDEFERARAMTLLTSREPAFRDFYAAPGSRDGKLRRGTRSLHRSVRTLLALRSLDPATIRELCFIDGSGAENARVVGNRPARYAELSKDENDNPFFAPAFATPAGEAYQSRPYVSPDTHSWVVGNAARLPGRGAPEGAIVHFELALASFADTIADDGARVAVVDGRTGAVVRGGTPPPVGRPLPHAAADLRRLASRPPASGAARVRDRSIAVRPVRASPGNANRWVVIASDRAPSGTVLGSLHGTPLLILVLALGPLAFGLGALRAAGRSLERAAHTDALTGLANRRRLVADLDHVVARTALTPATLLFFDLDGFKAYNDTFGHPAGDALLARLGHRLRSAAEPTARAYRLGGDEFCVLHAGAPEPDLEARTLSALWERGEGFEVSASIGAVRMPDETTDASEALRIADTRMYRAKAGRRGGPGRQTADALLRALAERDLGFGAHTDGVTDLTLAVAERLGLADEAVDHVRLAAELHDVGKLSIPDSILRKPGALDRDEWTFMRRHTIVGERICSAAPGLASVAPLVRSSHERWDGGGYPDGLVGDEIPLGARIVAICDTYAAITADRPYRRRRTPEAALEELRRCAGTQFDPAIVETFAAVVLERSVAPEAVPDALPVA